MKCNKNTYSQKFIITAIGCLLGITFVLSGCGSSSSTPAATTPTTPATTYTASGKITDSLDLPLANVTVKAIYTDTDPTNPSTMTAPDGTYTLTLDGSKTVSLQASLSGYVTTNTIRRPVDANATGVDIDLVTPEQAQSAITTVFGLNAPLFVNHAWLAIDVTNNGVDVGGATIESDAFAEAFLDCNGDDSLLNVTTGPCPSDDRAAAYIGWFNVSKEITVTIGGTVIPDSEIAPVRLGEITIHEFD